MAEAVAYARLVRAARRLAEAVKRRDEVKRRAEAVASQLVKEFQEGLGRALRGALMASMTVEVGDGLRLRIATRGNEVEVKLFRGEDPVVHEDFKGVLDGELATGIEALLLNADRVAEAMEREARRYEEGAERYERARRRLEELRGLLHRLSSTAEAAP